MIGEGDMSKFIYTTIVWLLSILIHTYSTYASDQQPDDMELEEQQHASFLSILDLPDGAQLNILKYLSEKDLARAEQVSQDSQSMVRALRGLREYYLLATPENSPLSQSNSYRSDSDADSESDDTSLSPTSSKQTPFNWQNGKHFKELTDAFEKLAERELTCIVQALIRMIKSKKEFFDNRYESVLAIMKERIVSWMNESILTSENFDATFYEGLPGPNSLGSSHDEDEDPWRIAFMEGVERDESDEESSSDHSCPSSPEIDDYEYDQEAQERRDEKSNKDFERWKVDTISSTLDITLDTSDELTEGIIDMEAIHQFLPHVEDGYSWLLNEDIEGSMSTSEDFVEGIYQEIGMDQNLLTNILSGFWFEFDWEEFDIDDPEFIQKTYIKTLGNLLEGKSASTVKERILEKLEKLFTFHEKDFDEQFNKIPGRFNKYAEDGEWLDALIEWSVYTTYRNVFSKPHKRSRIRTYQTAEPAHPIFHDFNREDYLTKRLQEALERARGMYTKVYPHPDTRKIFYGKKGNGRAKLDMRKELTQLKAIGRTYELHRPTTAKSANVFVPMLYLITSRGALDVAESIRKRFIPVPLMLQGTNNRAITRADTDIVFQGKDNAYYFTRVRQDVKRGKELQGIDGDEADKAIVSLIQNKGLCNTHLVHSERVLIEVLRSEDYVRSIAEYLSKIIIEEGKTGIFGVYGAVMLAYSTNTVCPNCTPSLISLQNSGPEEGGFLALLASSLNNIRGPISFKVKGYNQEHKTMDWSRFRLNTFVTASINFDPQAHDMAEEGQHMHAAVSNPPQKTHNPHARLYFLDDGINISPNKQEAGAFFYEFVGKDMHTQPAWNGSVNDFKSVVFASGSIPWKLP